MCNGSNQFQRAFTWIHPFLCKMRHRLMRFWFIYLLNALIPDLLCLDRSFGWMRLPQTAGRRQQDRCLHYEIFMENASYGARKLSFSLGPCADFSAMKMRMIRPIMGCMIALCPCISSLQHRPKADFQEKTSKCLAEFREMLTFALAINKGRLAQLVQSICLTDRGSVVRIR